MPERYAKLSPDVRIFRTAKLGGGYLPAGHLLPKPEWLEPNTTDEAEAKQTGRAPGVSVWAVPGATHEAACWIRRASPAEQRSFVATVASLSKVAEAHRREVSVVSDGLPPPENDVRWRALTKAEQDEVRSTCDAHSLIEGIKRPSQLAKVTHHNFREELARQFEPLA